VPENESLEIWMVAVKNPPVALANVEVYRSSNGIWLVGAGVGRSELTVLMNEGVFHDQLQAIWRANFRGAIVRGRISPSCLESSGGGVRYRYEAFVGMDGNYALPVAWPLRLYELRVRGN
jgi:hypothetical protein